VKNSFRPASHICENRERERERERPGTKMQDLQAVKGEEICTALLEIVDSFSMNLVPGMSLSMKVPELVAY
jgi:hypothetical protein